jgi:cation:H+ antiporter
VHVHVLGWLFVALVGVGAIVWGAETFAEHLAAASGRLGVSTFALAVLLAGAEPEELATAVTASLRDVPAIALGDVIGANVTICTVAVGVGALVAPLPFDRRIRRYALAGIPAGLVAAAFAWDGTVDRLEGAVLVTGYVLFVATIWFVERAPPMLGEVAELDTDHARASDTANAATAGATADVATRRSRVGRELGLVVAGVAAMAIGAMALVEGIRRVSGVERTQAQLGIVVVGFATAFELVVLAWASARHGITTAVVAGIIGSYTYNVTMTLGAGALARPLTVTDAELLRLPWIAMVAALAVVIALGWRRGQLDRRAGVICLALYPVFVGVVLLA